MYFNWLTCRKVVITFNRSIRTSAQTHVEVCNRPVNPVDISMWQWLSSVEAEIGGIYLKMDPSETQTSDKLYHYSKYTCHVHRSDSSGCGDDTVTFLFWSEDFPPDRWRCITIMPTHENSFGQISPEFLFVTLGTQTETGCIFNEAVSSRHYDAHSRLSFPLSAAEL